MIDRRALIIGSWLAREREGPTWQKVKSITNRWKKLFESERYGFRGLTDRESEPKIFHNPQYSDLVQHFEGAGGNSEQTELLLYFLGHSTAVGESDLELILDLKEGGKKEAVCRLSRLLEDIQRYAGVVRVIVILDTCHAGRTEFVFRLWDAERYFAMLATGNAYAFNAVFSEGLMRALETPLRRNDQRIDRRVGGVTYKKIFESARNFVIKDSSESGRKQNPMSLGQYSGKLLETPIVIPTEYNRFASPRSIYGRMFCILKIIGDSMPEFTFGQLRDTIDDNENFMLRRDDDGDHFLSSSRLRDYLDFLVSAKWVSQLSPSNYRLTRQGGLACNAEQFNQTLVEAIESEVLPESVSIEFLKEMVKAGLFHS